ncbi:hypothetical protein M758_12G119400 [Ceratodon purpureus]|nr:hypothetical protein M758_12G119400 [Ceratodon purpureus]
MMCFYEESLFVQMGSSRYLASLLVVRTKEYILAFESFCAFRDWCAFVSLFIFFSGHPENLPNKMRGSMIIRGSGAYLRWSSILMAQDLVKPAIRSNPGCLFSTSVS